MKGEKRTKVIEECGWGLHSLLRKRRCHGWVRRFQSRWFRPTERPLKEDAVRDLSDPHEDGNEAASPDRPDDPRCRRVQFRMLGYKEKRERPIPTEIVRTPLRYISQALPLGRRAQTFGSRFCRTPASERLRDEVEIHPAHRAEFSSFGSPHFGQYPPYVPKSVHASSPDRHPQISSPSPDQAEASSAQ